MNDDIHLADSLQTKFDNDKSRLILDSGYGIDAVTKGKITRVHHDLDIILVTDDTEKAQTNSYILNELLELDKTNWESKPTSKNWVWIREKKEAEVKFPRQINIHIIKLIKESTNRNYFLVESSNGIQYKLYIRKSKLLDLSGNSYIFTTLTPEEYLVNKIRLIPKYSPNWDIREQDVNDLRKLFNLRRIDLKKVSNFLKEFLMGTHSNIPVSYYWNKLTEKYSSTMSKKQLTFLKAL